MLDAEKNYIGLMECARNEGGDVFGVCQIDPFQDRFLFTGEESDGLPYAVVIGVALSEAVLAGIDDRPTLLYKWHYRQTNNLLDRLAFRLTQRIMAEGYRALPVPASQIIDWESQKGHLSHRMLAEAAGLGWRGRNNLLVNTAYGSRLRLVSILTDMALKTDTPVENGCGLCQCCVRACPAGALGKDASEYDFDRCYEKLKDFSKIRGIGQYICGVCVKTCPSKKHL